jgi:hypothetical protein
MEENILFMGSFFAFVGLIVFTMGSTISFPPPPKEKKK